MLDDGDRCVREWAMVIFVTMMADAPASMREGCCSRLFARDGRAQRAESSVWPMVAERSGRGNNTSHHGGRFEARKKAERDSRGKRETCPTV